jgi:hypothetical protein
MTKKIIVSKKIKKSVVLPAAEHNLGYSDAEIRTFMSKHEYKKFGDWIVGQTCGVDEKGIVRFYPWDVHRFLELIRLERLTYFD